VYALPTFSQRIEREKTERTEEKEKGKEKGKDKKTKKLPDIHTYI